MRVLTGIQSSGTLHLGNYFGAIKQMVELQAFYIYSQLPFANLTKRCKSGKREHFRCSHNLLGSWH